MEQIVTEFGVMRLQDGALPPSYSSHDLSQAQVHEAEPEPPPYSEICHTTYHNDVVHSSAVRPISTGAELRAPLSDPRAPQPGSPCQGSPLPVHRPNQIIHRLPHRSPRASPRASPRPSPRGLRIDRVSIEHVTREPPPRPEPPSRVSQSPIASPRVQPRRAENLTQEQSQVHNLGQSTNLGQTLNLGQGQVPDLGQGQISNQVRGQPVEIMYRDQRQYEVPNPAAMYPTQNNIQNSPYRYQPSEAGMNAGYSANHVQEARFSTNHIDERFPVVHEQQRTGRFSANQIPELFPANHVPERFPVNQVVERFPTNQIPERFPANQIPERFPANQIPERFPANQGAERFTANRVDERAAASPRYATDSRYSDYGHPASRAPPTHGGYANDVTYRRGATPPMENPYATPPMGNRGNTPTRGVTPPGDYSTYPMGGSRGGTPTRNVAPQMGGGDIRYGSPQPRPRAQYAVPRPGLETSRPQRFGEPVYAHAEPRYPPGGPRNLEPGYRQPQMARPMYAEPVPRHPGPRHPDPSPVDPQPAPATLSRTLPAGGKKPSPPNQSLKEAEVDALTTLLLRNMEASKDPTFYGMCVSCGQMIVGEDTGCTALEQVYHISCFICTQCGKSLKGLPFFAIENRPFCEQCYIHTLEKCSVCSQPITDRILRATGKPYHPRCFTCVVCGKSLDGIPFTVDANNQIHCIEDFHRKFAPRCSMCEMPIMPEVGAEETVRVVAMDRSFHVGCYKCEDCGLVLSSEAEGRGCYPLDDHLLCKTCNGKRIQVLTNKMSTEL